MIEMYLVKTIYMVADIFTKATDTDTFLKMSNNMRNVRSVRWAPSTVEAKANRLLQAFEKTCMRFRG